MGCLREPFGRDFGALDERFEFGPDEIRVDHAEPCVRAEAAVRRSEDGGVVGDGFGVVSDVDRAAGDFPAAHPLGDPVNRENDGTEREHRELEAV